MELLAFHREKSEIPFLLYLHMKSQQTHGSYWIAYLPHPCLMASPFIDQGHGGHRFGISILFQCLFVYPHDNLYHPKDCNFISLCGHSKFAQPLSFAELTGLLGGFYSSMWSLGYVCQVLLIILSVFWLAFLWIYRLGDNLHFYNVEIFLRMNILSGHSSHLLLCLSVFPCENLKG